MSQGYFGDLASATWCSPLTSSRRRARATSRSRDRGAAAGAGWIPARGSELDDRFHTAAVAPDRAYGLGVRAEAEAVGDEPGGAHVSGA